MFALLTGRMPGFPSRALVARSAALAAVLGLAGCASDPNTRTAQYVAPQIVADAAEVEDDGLPSQTPPPARVRQAPDDPSEPFSRNYGGSNPAVKAGVVETPPEVIPAPSVKPSLPRDLPEEFRRKLVHAMAETEE